MENKNNETELIVPSSDAIDVVFDKLTKKTTIIYNKNKIKGKASNKDVLDVALICAKLQIEKYLEKIGRGVMLEPQEVRCLVELANISKIELPNHALLKEQNKISDQTISDSQEEIKAGLYSSFLKKLEEPK